ncbi:5141_t:CDS:2 [Gigaspora rosea]|nr:5141_t:CDS:2 [Gigaspora rosea]
MSKKQKKVMEVSPLEARTISEETIKSEPSGSREQEAQSQESPLSPQTKAYLDTIIQNTTASLVQSMRQYMGQQFETINKSNTHGNTEQATSTRHTQINSQEPIRVISTGSNVDQFEGNYPLTPMLNSTKRPRENSQP